MNRPENSRVIVITGASAGIGRATARRFAREGARLGLLARGPEALESARREVVELGGEALTLPCDVAHAPQVERAAAAVEAQFGPIDVWVNNAMASVFSPIVDTPPEEFRRVMEVTYLGYVHGTLSALRRMRPRNRGVIVQVGSGLARRGIPLQAAYCAAKHAVDGFCDSLRSELRHDRSAVQVTQVHLSAFNTPQFGWVKSRLPRRAQPLPPIFQPEVAADAIAYASRHPRRQLVVGFPAWLAITSQKFAPGLVDRILARQAYDGQQTREPEDPGRPDNLWHPVAGDRGAHGAFDDRARGWSAQWWLSRHRGWVAAGLAAVTLAAVTHWKRRHRT